MQQFVGMVISKAGSVMGQSFVRKCSGWNYTELLKSEGFSSSEVPIRHFREMSDVIWKFMTNSKLFSSKC